MIFTYSSKVKNSLPLPALAGTLTFSAGLNIIFGPLQSGKSKLLRVLATHTAIPPHLTGWSTPQNNPPANYPQHFEEITNTNCKWDGSPSYYFPQSSDSKAQLKQLALDLRNPPTDLAIDSSSEFQAFLKLRKTSNTRRITLLLDEPDFRTDPLLQKTLWLEWIPGLARMSYQIIVTTTSLLALGLKQSIYPVKYHDIVPDYRENLTQVLRERFLRKSKVSRGDSQN